MSIKTTTILAFLFTNRLENTEASMQELRDATGSRCMTSTVANLEEQGLITTSKTTGLRVASLTDAGRKVARTIFA